jgi:DNA-binding HxlR family transcriptional regulator
MGENNPEEDTPMSHLRPREGVIDDDLERKRRKAVLNALESNPDGLGFNELLREVNKSEKIISRNTLKDRLEQYEDEEGLIQTDDNYRPGQKKKIQLTEMGQKPKEVNESYEYWEEKLLKVWSNALKMYRKDGKNRSDILHYVFNKRLRYDLANAVLTNTTEKYRSDLSEIELPKRAIPKPEEKHSDGEFFRGIAAELYKLYTEKIFGNAYIETDDRAVQLQKDVMIDTYGRTGIFRDRMNILWQDSEVPMPYEMKSETNEDATSTSGDSST